MKRRPLVEIAAAVNGTALMLVSRLSSRRAPARPTSISTTITTPYSCPFLELLTNTPFPPLSFVRRPR